MSKFERILELGSTELPDCRFCPETQLTGVAKESLVSALALREEFRDEFARRHDPIAADRLLWRAQSFRHLTHLLPGQTILEVGYGNGLLTRYLVQVSRGENPITAVTFRANIQNTTELPASVEWVVASDLPGVLAGRQFDLVVLQDMLDHRTCAWLTERVYELLAPGGQAVFYESNPWNILLQMRRLVSKLLVRKVPRLLLNRIQLYELFSEIGFVRVFTTYEDFVYGFLSWQFTWLLRNLSIVLENAPIIQTLSRSILVYTQKPPRRFEPLRVSISAPPKLHRAVSVIVPCYNEEMNVGPLATNLMALFDDYIHEIIFIDDNSSDGTRAAIATLTGVDERIKAVHRKPPNGVGLALADGIRAATGQYLLLMDCDFQHVLPEVRDLFDTINSGYEVAIGSRFSRHSVLLNYPFMKIVANRLFHGIAQIALLSRFRDLTNNLKLIPRIAAERLVLLEPGFAANAEIGLQLLIMGYPLKEVPISWIGRGHDMGRSSFRLVSEGGSYWRVLCRVWLRQFVGVGVYHDVPSRPWGE